MIHYVKITVETGLETEADHIARLEDVVGVHTLDAVADFAFHAHLHFLKVRRYTTDGCERCGADCRFHVICLLVTDGSGSDRLRHARSIGRPNSCLLRRWLFLAARRWPPVLNRRE